MEEMCFYIAYNTPTGSSWRIINTELDLDKSSDFQKWIVEEEKRRGFEIVPIFWKKLSNS